MRRRTLPPVFADRDQIERVIVNLVTNASRATSAGRHPSRLRPPRRGSDVVFSVTDTGAGIPRDYLPRIFEPFIQVPNAPAGGSGLGLTISRRIVEAHGGQLTRAVRARPRIHVHVSPFRSARRCRPRAGRRIWRCTMKF